MLSSLGEKLRYLREKKGLKQEDVARFLEVSRASVSKYESGSREPDINTLKTLAKYYNVPVDYLFGLTDTPYSLDKEPNLTAFGDSLIKEEEPLTLLDRYKDLMDLLMSDDFFRLAKKIKEHRLDPKSIETIINSIILMNENQKHP